MAGTEEVVAWRVMFFAESLPQLILILTAPSLPLFLNLKVPCFIILREAPREGGTVKI